MLRAVVFTFALLWASGAVAQVTPGGNNSGNTVTQSGTVTAGDCAQWVATGVIKDSGSTCGGGGGGGLTVNTTTVSGGAAGDLLYTDGTLLQAALLRYTSAALNLGAADAAAAVAQTVNVQNVVAGTSNTAGANFTINGSIGTGTGAGGLIIFQTAKAGLTGTAQNSLNPLLELLTTAISGNPGSQQYVSIDTGGQLIVPATGRNNTTIFSIRAASNSSNDGVNLVAGGGINVIGNGNLFSQLDYRLILSGNGYLGFGNSSFSSGSPDTFVSRPGAATIQLGNADAAAPVAQTLQVQSVVTATSNTGGANWTLNASNSTGTGVGGKFIVQTAVTGTTGSSPNSRFPLLTLNPGGATTSTVQFGDGTNITTYDSCTALTTGATGVMACTASAASFKNILGTVTPTQASDGLDRLRVGAPVWEYKDEYVSRFGEGVRVGLIANDVEQMDPRCVVHKDGGGVSDYWDRCVIAYLVADRQKMKSQIADLQRMVR